MTGHRREAIEAAGLALELLAEGDVIRGEGSLLQFAPPVEIGVWYGPGQTLERWREAAQATWPGIVFGGEETRSLGGATARRVEAEIPADAGAEGGFATPEGGLEYRSSAAPAKTAVVSALEHRGMPILVSWTVEAGRREALRAAEERFFAGLVLV